MAGIIQTENCIATCYARLALSDGNGKWVPGTVLELYPLDWNFNWGDKAHYLIVTIKITDEQIDLAINRKLRIPLESFLSPASFQKYQVNLSINDKADFEATGEKPKLQKQVDAVACSEITPESQWSKEPELQNLPDPDSKEGV